MPETIWGPWSSRSPWSGLGHGSHMPEAADWASIEYVEGVRLACVVGRHGGDPALDAALASMFGEPPPTSPRFVGTARARLLWTGPRRWLAVGDTVDPQMIADRLEGLAAVSSQSDASALLRLSGSQAREVLGRGCLIDLHPRRFSAGDVATTLIAHVGVQLWQTDERPAYELAVPRSLAGSFRSWLLQAARLCAPS